MMITVMRNITFCQAANCLIFFQIRYTGVAIGKKRGGHGIKVYIAAPVHNPDLGYRCTRWGVNVPQKRKASQ